MGSGIKEQNIKAMGQPLDVQYTQLWQEIAQLNIVWKEFVELFGTKPSRIELLEVGLLALSSAWSRTVYGKR